MDLRAKAVCVVGVMAASSIAACVSAKNEGPSGGDDAGYPGVSQDGAAPTTSDSSSATNDTGTGPADNDGGTGAPDSGAEDGAAPPSGTLDPGFGGKGYVTGSQVTTADGGVTTSVQIRGVVVDSQGRIVIAGDAYSGVIPNIVVVSRFLASGAPDTSFATGGTLATRNTPSDLGDAYGRGVCLDGSGNIVVGGYEYGDGPEAWRITPAGALDSTFGAGGYVQSTAGGVTYAVVCTAAGIVVVGNGATLTRYTNAGALDTASFAAPNGYVNDPLYDNSNAASLAVDGNGKIIIGGEAVNGSADVGAGVWRYTSAGALDTTFGSSAMGSDVLGQIDAGIDAGEVGGAADGVAVDSANDILLAISSPTPGVARLTPAGKLDTTFGGSGFAFLPVPSQVSGALAVAPQLTAITLDGEGRVLVVGYTEAEAVGGSGYMAVWRLTSTGALDTTFGTGGAFAMTGTAGGKADYAMAVVADATNHPVVAGTSEDPAGGNVAALWRLAP